MEEESLEEVPDWAKLDIDSLRADAASTNWTELLAEKGTESMWELFKSKMCRNYQAETSQQSKEKLDTSLSG